MATHKEEEKVTTNDEIMRLLRGCYEPTEGFNNDLSLLNAVKYFVTYNNMMVRNVSNDFEKKFFRIMNDSMLSSDQLSSLIKRFDFNEINKKFGKSDLGPLIRRLKESDVDLNLIPSDFDERIEKYLSTKK